MVKNPIKKLGSSIAYNFDNTLLKVLTWRQIRIPLPERNPFQLIIIVFILVADVLILAHADVSPPSLEKAGAFGVGVTWAIAIGATLATLGILYPDREVGLAFEQFAHSLLCFASWGYVFTLVTYNGVNASLLVGGYTAGVAVGAWARACHILLFNRQIAILTGKSRVHIPGGPSHVAPPS